MMHESPRKVQSGSSGSRGVVAGLHCQTLSINQMSVPSLTNTAPLPPHALNLGAEGRTKKTRAGDPSLVHERISRSCHGLISGYLTIRQHGIQDSQSLYKLVVPDIEKGWQARFACESHDSFTVVRQLIGKTHSRAIFQKSWHGEQPR